jgi:PAS domain-containing protein
MSKMKYLWAAALLALCVCLTSSAALAADGWAIATDDDGNLIQDYPTGIIWDGGADVSVEAENTGDGPAPADTWDPNYVLASVDGPTLTASVLNRWGFEYAPAAGVTPPVDVGDSFTFAYTITGPPITTLDYAGAVGITATAGVDDLTCDWQLASDKTSLAATLITSDIVRSNVVVSRYYEVAPDGLGEWARFEIEEISGRVPSIASGFSPGVYGPTVPVSRDQMAVFIARAAKLAILTPAEATFGDVPTDYWAYSEIETLVDAGIVAGYGGDTYQPTWTVTRAQMAVFVTNATGYDAPDPADDLFLDVPVGYWADNEIGACVDNLVVSGYADGYYRPAWTLTRDQMAVFMYRAFIQATGCAVVLGGPATTDVNPATATYAGWTSQDTDPGYAYVLFDEQRLDDNLDGDANSNWEVQFDFRAAATPTTTGTVVNRNVPVASIPGAGTYLVVSTPVPGLAAGDYVMVVLVEDETGAMVEIARTVALTIS